MKELWIDAWEEKYNAALDRGLSEEEAGQYADTHADETYRDRIADAIDFARLIKKEAV